MSDDKQDDSKAGSSLCASLVAQGRVLELGPGGFKSWVRDQVVKVIFDNLSKWMTAIAKRIEEGDLAAFKYVLELAYKLEDDREDTQVVLESFAELLITELKSLPAETGDTAEAGAEAPAGI